MHDFISKYFVVKGCNATWFQATCDRRNHAPPLILQLQHDESKIFRKYNNSQMLILCFNVQCNYSYFRRIVDNKMFDTIWNYLSKYICRRNGMRTFSLVRVLFKGNLVDFTLKGPVMELWWLLWHYINIQLNKQSCGFNVMTAASHNAVVLG